MTVNGLFEDYEVKKATRKYLSGLVSSFDYGRLFLENVFEFIEQTALSMSSCVGYLVPCLLSTTAFVMGLNSLISNESRCFPCNLHMSWSSALRQLGSPKR